MGKHTWSWGGLVNNNVIVEVIDSNGKIISTDDIDLIISRGDDFFTSIDYSDDFTVVLKVDGQWIANLPCFFSC